MTTTTYCQLHELLTFLQLADDAVTGVTRPDAQTLGRNIQMAAAEINMSLQASDQLSCTKSDDATEFLKLLNVVGAALLTEHDNVRFWTDETKRRYQEWKDSNIALLRSGELAVCQGETGLNYPAFAVAEQAWTDEAAFKIYINYVMRSTT